MGIASLVCLGIVSLECGHAIPRGVEWETRGEDMVSDCNTANRDDLAWEAEVPKRIHLPFVFGTVFDPGGQHGTVAFQWATCSSYSYRLFD